jgi:hypothetical protein
METHKGPPYITFERYKNIVNVRYYPLLSAIVHPIIIDIPYSQTLTLPNYKPIKK